LGLLTARLQDQLFKSVDGMQNTSSVHLYELLAKLIFQASVASIFNEEAGNDADLFGAFQAFDQHMPLAMGGLKVIAQIFVISQAILWSCSRLSDAAKFVLLPVFVC
jgi:hypothetical protein